MYFVAWASTTSSWSLCLFTTSWSLPHSDPGLLRPEWSASDLHSTYCISYTSMNFHRRKRTLPSWSHITASITTLYWGGWYKHSWEYGGRGVSDLNHVCNWHGHAKCLVLWKFELKRCLIMLGIVVFVVSLHSIPHACAVVKERSLHSTL